MKNSFFGPPFAFSGNPASSLWAVIRKTSARDKKNTYTYTDHLIPLPISQTHKTLLMDLALMAITDFSTSGAADHSEPVGSAAKWYGLRSPGGGGRHHARVPSRGR